MTEDHLSPAEIQSLIGSGDPSEACSAQTPEAANDGARCDAVAALDPRAVAGLRRMHGDFCQRLGVALSALLRPRAVKEKRHTLREKMWRCNSVQQRSNPWLSGQDVIPMDKENCDVCRPSI